MKFDPWVRPLNIARSAQEKTEMMKNKEGRMNRAEENIHREAGDRPKPRTAGVGREKKADLKGTQDGGSREEAQDSVPHTSTGLKGAMAELHRQHPHHHDDRGPHHGGKEHVRHEPVGKVYR